MALHQSPGSGLRHLVFLAVLGLGVVVLAGPVIALASVVLSVVLTVGSVLLVFAVIGFVFWAPVYYLYAGREVAGERIGALRKSLRGTIGHLAQIGKQAVVLPARFVGRLFRGGMYTAKVMGQFVGEVFLVGLTGTAIGAALGLTLAAVNNQNPADVIPINAAVGGGIAAVVGVALALMPKRGPSRRVAA